MQWQGSTLKSLAIPLGIIALEFCKNIDQIHFLLSHWSKESVIINVVLDFGYIAAYSFFFINSLKYFAQIHSAKKQCSLFLLLLSRWFWIAALFDVIENVGMLLSVNGIESQMILSITILSAILKFTLIILSMIAIVIALVINRVLK